MLPFLLPMWEVDATARAAVEQSAATHVTDDGAWALLTGGEVAADLAARAPRAEYRARADARYAHALDISPEGDAATPGDSVAAGVSAAADWTLSPRAYLHLGARGFLATRLGARAGDELAARDPFLSESRLQYTLGAGPALSVVTSRRAHLRLGAGYAQAGALAADDPAAAGVFAHTATAGAACAYELRATDTLTPEIRYEYTHFYHALIDVERRRGPADVHAGTAMLTASHEVTHTLTGRIGGGLTLASAPTFLASRAVTVAPAAVAGAAYVARAYDLTLGYRFEYTSLGPRIGFGQAHAGEMSVRFRPVAGGAHRDLVVTALGAIAAGSAPLAATPPPLSPAGEPAPPREGTLRTLTAVAGAQIEVPMVPGLAALARFDLEYVRATLDPTPAAGQAGGSLRTVWTVGIAGTVSTDRRNTIRRDLGDRPEDDLPREAPSTAGPSAAPRAGDDATSPRPLD